MLDCAARYKFKGAFPAAVLGKKYLGGPRPVSRNVVWEVECLRQAVPPPQKNFGIFSFEMVHFDAFWSTF